MRYVKLLVLMEDYLMLIRYVQDLLHAFRNFFFPMLFSMFLARVAHDLRSDIVAELII
jgi:hypothetical protein